MRQFMVIGFVGVVLTGSAVNAQPNNPQMQQMMQQMQAMQTCMQGIDRSQLLAFTEKAKQMGQEVKALCAAGKRDEAMRRAMSMGQQFANDPALQKAQGCGADLVKQLSAHAQGVTDPANPAHERKHVCDIPQP